MNEEQRKMINDTLVKFGASLTAENQFQKGNRVIPSVEVKIEKNRIRMINRMNGDLVMSGPVTPRSIESFVKKFWYWEKV